MTALLRLSVLSLCAVLALSFFDFLKSAPAKVVQHVDTNLIRGAPESLHARYLADPFVCDGKAQKSTIVNDGYCDCADKSDEPGTSACEGTVFHCINKGYKMIKISSSRVDDSVCDCCDGSDEGRVASCPNTCNEAAEKERAQLLKVTTNYKAGSAIRDELIRTVKNEKAQQAASITPLGMEIHRAREDVDVVQKELDEKVAHAKVLESSITEQQRMSLRAHLPVDTLDMTEASHYLSNLLKTLKVATHALPDAITPPAGDAAVAKSTMNDPADTSDTDDHDVDPPAHFGDEGIDTDDSYEASPEEINMDAEPAAASLEDTGVVSEEDKCPIVDATGDVFLTPFCKTLRTTPAVVDALLNVIIKRSAFNEAMLLLGHYQLHRSFIGSDLFALGHLADTPDTCPAVFEAIPAGADGSTHCGIRETLQNAVGTLEAQAGLPTLRAEIEALRARVREGNTKINDAENRLRVARSASDDIAKYQDHLEYLALKDQCFDKEDGAFIYSLCILGSIKQKEVSGHREVTLGTFDSFQDAYNLPAADGVVPSVVMKFGRGDHCHAFGARTATVTVSCAAKHALISATEPSTCAYKLHFESPAACTPKYAEQSGISFAHLA